ncbi:hypothetical protein HW555_001271 [Spodoptera exigua]|uniref:Uncharacterized protein n=1 Tax=Spodoptera exigua TaxID=7107 RepID=A0A835GSY8_SPOEX|nr:hypothetical protein HW555_001271 [Spodoptera exigua]
MVTVLFGGFHYSSPHQTPYVTPANQRRALWWTGLFKQQGTTMRNPSEATVHVGNHENSVTTSVPSYSDGLWNIGGHIEGGIGNGGAGGTNGSAGGNGGTFNFNGKAFEILYA